MYVEILFKYELYFTSELVAGNVNREEIMLFLNQVLIWRRESHRDYLED